MPRTLTRFSNLILFLLVGAAPLHAQTFTEIVDSATPVPGTAAGVFDFFSPYGLDAGDIAFLAVGTEPSGQGRGAYIVRDGILIRIADSHTAMPGQPTTLSFFYRLDLRDGTIAFSATAEDEKGGGVYRDRGLGLEVVADRSDLIPGTVTPFLRFGVVALDGDDVLFTGGASAQFSSGTKTVSTGGRPRASRP